MAFKSMADVEHWFDVTEAPESVRGKCEGIADAGRQLARTIFECVENEAQREPALRNLQVCLATAYLATAYLGVGR